MRIVSRQPSERAPARMGRLAVLPVFLTLEGKRAIVLGDTAAAAWKAEMLQACGASVERYAADWTEAVLSGAAIVVADASDDAEAAAIAQAAGRAGVPVNIIDRPAQSQFQFGSIVNRSPVVIGISTAGAAPVLSQAIRQRLESMLPASLAAWAALAQTLRGPVRARLPSTGRRRAFWERFAAKAFGPAPDEKTGARLLQSLAEAKSLPTGRVTLVGAGPGDAELLTLKALRALQSADVILFDDLVSDEVLELARREARRLLVGKRGGRESCRQEDINETMVRLAKAGKHVVRLKSGDPMIFGRGGEEIDQLRQEGIGVEVVPGVTSALSMAARLGVSLTHRDHAQSVRFVTGHARDGGLPDNLDWRALANPRATTIYYMAGATAGQIAVRLLQEGMRADTPVAIAASLARADEELLGTTLAGLSTFDRAAVADKAVLIGIGSVFAAAQISSVATARGSGSRQFLHASGTG